jgi:hypothetical protein
MEQEYVVTLLVNVVADDKEDAEGLVLGALVLGALDDSLPEVAVMKIEQVVEEV